MEKLVSLEKRSCSLKSKSHKEKSSSTKQNGESSELFSLDKYTKVFVLGKMQSTSKRKYPFTHLFRFLFLFLLIFNFLYFADSFIASILFSGKHPFHIVSLNRITLSLGILFFILRIILSSYGVYAATCANNRMPLFLLMLITLASSVMITLFGWLVIIFQYLPKSFENAINFYTQNSDNESQSEWPWIKLTQQTYKCCGYNSYHDFITAQQNDTKNPGSILLPLSCCEGDELTMCPVASPQRFPDYCLPWVMQQQRDYIIFPFTFLLILDTCTLFLCVYMMHSFRYHLQRITVPENRVDYLIREENRLINALLKDKFVNETSWQDNIRKRFRLLIQAEDAKGERQTLEMLAIAIHKLEDESISLMTIKPQFNIDLRKASDLKKNTEIIQKITEDLNKKISHSKITEIERENKEVFTQPAVANMDIIKSSVKLSIEGGENNEVSFAPKTRNANMEIKKRLDILNKLQMANEETEEVRRSSLDLRLDKKFIGNMIKDLTIRSNKMHPEAKRHLEAEKKANTVIVTIPEEKGRLMKKIIKLGKEKRTNTKQDKLHQILGYSNELEEDQLISYDIYDVWDDISL